jgi:mannose-6-phosphate isomerase-like protein (cupin superfamily)
VGIGFYRECPSITPITYVPESSPPRGGAGAGCGSFRCPPRCGHPVRRSELEGMSISEPLASYRTFDGSEYSVLERPQDSDGALVMRFRLTPRAGSPPPHVHPYTVEVFEILEGELEMLIGREWRKVGPGESATVEAGVRHSFRNTSGAEVVIRNVHDPHHDFEAYIRSLAKVSQELRVSTPNSPGAVARVALIWGRHDDLIRPADLPLKIAFPILRGAGRLGRLSVPD